MAAPSIPNLLSLRDGGRGGGRGGRGRRPGGPGGPGEPPATSRGASTDSAIQGTDTDAAVSRLSVVDLGYLNDPYAKLFVSGPPTRRLPIINRGTYMRTKALDIMIDGFLQQNTQSPKQIISLGAGSDTRPLHLFQRDETAELAYHEVDFEPTCNRKRTIVQSAPSLRQIFTEIKAGNEDGSWSAMSAKGGSYYCHALDLRDLSDLPSSVQPDVPTLVLSECCLCYLEAGTTTSLLKMLATKVHNLAVLLYEPMPLNDAFGTMMMSNLKARGIHMPSLHTCRNEEGQLERLESAGFTKMGFATVEDAWETWVDGQERERVDGLEGLDEVEEWKLLAAHYVVVWGTKGNASYGEAPRI